MEEGLLPLVPRRRLDAEATAVHVQEERRLFFVGLTRAITTLFLSWCGKRSLHGGPPEDRFVSSMVQELPSHFFTAPPVIRARKHKPRHQQLSLFS